MEIKKISKKEHYDSLYGLILQGIDLTLSIAEYHFKDINQPHELKQMLPFYKNTVLDIKKMLIKKINTKIMPKKEFEKRLDRKITKKDIALDIMFNK